jgi:eukaryotic-like serine/threonine-protein kinase
VTQQVGKYQLIRKLATGGMAEVYLAKAAGPRGFEKTLVVKCILPHLAQEPSFVEMFLSEAKLAAQLSHTHVVQIFDFGEADGSYFLAMEYIDGPSLRTLIKRAAAQNLPLDPSVCARLVSQACEGLAFAHDFVDPVTEQPLALIHRDVSPDNLLLSRQGSVKVVDFGIAKATGQTHRTESGVIKGKLAYMPPEQLRAKNLDRRVDVYGLGVVLYELLTFHKPYGAASDVALMHAILYGVPTPAAHHRPDLPVALQRILARAIAKDREQRYPDCHSLQADLEDFILSGGRPVTGQQVAQLIQRATSTHLPALNLPPGVPPSPAPLPPRDRPGSDMHSTTPEEAASREEEERATVPEHTAVTQDLSRTLPPTVAGRTGPRARRRWALRAWKRHALVGGILLSVGGGLARLQQDPREDKAPSPSLEVSQPSPAEPALAPPALAQAPQPAAPAPQEPDAVAETAPSEPQTSPPETAAPLARKRIARPAKAKRPLTGMGSLAVRAHPYAIVYVDGQEQGETPLEKDLELPAGSYTMKLVIPDLSKTVTQQVEIKPGQRTNIVFAP